MDFAISEHLKKEAKQTITKMIKQNSTKMDIPGGGFYITTKPIDEPDGTLFLDEIEVEGQKFYVCQKNSQ